MIQAANRGRWYRPLYFNDMTHFWDKVNIVHLSFKWENYLNSFSNKTVTISMDRQQKNGLNVIPFVFFNNTIIVQVRYIIVEKKKLPVLYITGFFFRIRTQVTALVLHTSAFTWVLMRKKKPIISNTGRFFCFNSTEVIGRVARMAE